MRTMARYNGRDVDVDKLLVAAERVLNLLADMTTEEFERGADRECRRELAIALGYDPSEYSL